MKKIRFLLIKTITLSAVFLLLAGATFCHFEQENCKNEHCRELRDKGKNINPDEGLYNRIPVFTKL